MATILITGANRGIGLELARQYAAAGDTVIRAMRGADKADGALGEALPLDVTGNQVERALDVAAAKTKDGSAIPIGIVNPQAKPQSIAVKFSGVKPGKTSWSAVSE